MNVLWKGSSTQLLACNPVMLVKEESKMPHLAQTSKGSSCLQRLVPFLIKSQKKKIDLIELIIEQEVGGA